MIVPNTSATNARTQWALLTLRLFLGLTFIYAGIQKLTDPQFFRPSAAGYIGKQIAAYALGSPLHSFLLQVAEPHATLFGLLVAYGEIAIGFGTLLGFLLRPAAAFGVLINLVFFLSATWKVYPFFYGSDIIFIFCWLALLINGPRNTGLPTFDEVLFSPSSTSPSQSSNRFAHTLRVILGTEEQPTPAVVDKQQKGTKPGSRQGRQSPAQRAAQTRRNFLAGLFTGGIGAVALLGLGYVLRVFPHGSEAPAVQPPASTSVPGATPGTTGTAASNVIAQVNSVPTNSSASFTIPSTGDPGVLVHLTNGQFVAYDALCTHAGCPVGYDPTSKLLLCPCHGAAFDPAKGAAVVQPPANTPLTSVAISVNSATGTITLQGS